jgi:hypothetical protein
MLSSSNWKINPWRKKLGLEENFISAIRKNNWKVETAWICYWANHLKRPCISSWPLMFCGPTNSPFLFRYSARKNATLTKGNSQYIKSWTVVVYNNRSPFDINQVATNRQPTPEFLSSLSDFVRVPCSFKSRNSLAPGQRFMRSQILGTNPEEHF